MAMTSTRNFFAVSTPVKYSRTGEEVAQDVAAFLKSGGKIEVLDWGARSPERVFGRSKRPTASQFPGTPAANDDTDKETA